MLEHNNTIWGSICSCGNEVYILQNKFHPWNETDFTIELICPNCKKLLIVDQKKAANYYNEKIYSYYNHVTGNVIDLGCGGGFISNYLSNNNDINKISALDIDETVKDYINNINPNRVHFIHAGAHELSQHFDTNSVDYLVHRDVFMFIEDTKKYFDDITNIVSKGIVHIGWYLSNNERMKNKLLPVEIKEELENRGWMVTLEYLPWYKCGYIIIANKKQHK